MTTQIGLVFFIAAIGLCVIGIGGIVLSRNLFRMVLALAIAEAGANLLLVLAGYRWDAVAPILSAGQMPAPMVDPVPQAMVLTAIVIGVGVQALALTLVVRVKQRYGTLDMQLARERMNAEIDATADVTPPRSQERPRGERPLPAPAGGAHD
ncbi:MAG: NADH-quinone oxidoreductase subunit K [Gammaproteobacteria bacterium]|nr:NADH-quinone oxidoreductase subunit K [Gammaproteobacteria bacterium]